MAFSQKYPGLMIVPWSNRKEWTYTYKLLRDVEHIDQLREASSILHEWKVRTHNLPAGIEGTLILLNALLQDETSIPTSIISNAYGMMLMRFLNLCCHGRQGTFSETVKANNIPEWIVNLRHKIAHNHSLPDIAKVKSALIFCFDWIVETYWKKQSNTLVSHAIWGLSHEQVQLVMHFYCKSVYINYINGGNLSLQDLGQIDPTWKENLENLLSCLDLKLTASLQYGSLQLLMRIKNNCEVAKSDLIFEMIPFESFFYMREEDNDKLLADQYFATDYINCWSTMIEFFYDYQYLGDFLIKLLDFIQDDEHDHDSFVACIWIYHILQKFLLAQLLKYSHLSGIKKYSYFKMFPMMKQMTPFKNVTGAADSLIKKLEKFSDLVYTKMNPHIIYFYNCLIHVCNYPEVDQDDNGKDNSDGNGDENDDDNSDGNSDGNGDENNDDNSDGNGDENDDDNGDENDDDDGDENDDDDGDENDDDNGDDNSDETDDENEGSSPNENSSCDNSETDENELAKFKLVNVVAPNVVDTLPIRDEDILSDSPFRVLDDYIIFDDCALGDLVDEDVLLNEEDV